MFLVLFALLFITILPSLGFFTIPSFILISSVVVFVLFYLWKNKDIDVTEELHYVLLILLGYSAIAYGGLYQVQESIALGRIILIAFTIIICLVHFKFIHKKKRDKKTPRILFFIFALFMTMGVFTIMFSPKPTIDALYVLKEAPQMFLQGENPYSATFTKVYENIEPTYYNYLPLSFILLSPIVLLFKDPRYAMILAHAASGILLYHLYKKKIKPYNLSTILASFLFLPGTFFMIEHTYIDQVIFFVFLLTIYLQEKKHNLSALALGTLFSFKQNLLVLLPNLAPSILLKPKHRTKRIVLFLIPFTVIPVYLFMNTPAFLEDVLFGLKPDAITSPIHSSLTLATLIKRFIIKTNTAYTVSFVFFAVAYTIMLKSKSHMYLKSLAAVLFFFYFSYHAFFNSYYFISMLMFLYIIDRYATQKSS